ncbi:peptidoglycan D,D-transpeptidase FtsI family protein [Paenibacillus turpanensis]|uniref:peptidoglycan D,D-transpeptidase FtsI family protein n=1 Tax=Paenibacillus turpanensis TaxID=2689078 RepID=UPI00140BAD12|nr:penicillin-binding transpeptidase domain-containing protein [Paenibacillus turpanensis]
MRQHRIFIALLSICIVFAVLAGRLLWLQTAGTALLSRASVDQRKAGFILDTGRAQFYDQSGAPLTGYLEHRAALFPVLEQRSLQPSQHKDIARVLNVPVRQWITFYQEVQRTLQPAMWSAALTKDQQRQIREADFPGLRVVEVNRRYAQDGLASHLIGYMSEQPILLKQYKEDLQRGILRESSPLGASGLERSLDRLLHGIGPTTVFFYTDGLGRPMHGLDLRYSAPQSSYYPLKVMTTLNKELQADVERILQRNGIRQGAAVVLEAETGSVAAMASVPEFTPESVDPDDEHWANRALKAITPGSVFKLAVAAAALEHHVVSPDEQFECSGEWGKYGFSCWKKGGHGQLSFEEAFAHSCNIVFGKVMLRLPEGAVSRAAEQLGLVHPVGWKTDAFRDGQPLVQFAEEESGTIFAGDVSTTDEGILLQTAIGQRDVRITPLQAANAAASIAAGKAPQAVRAVQEIRYADGRLQARFPSQPAREGISPLSEATYSALRRMMRLTVTDGTASSLKSSMLPVSGKTGTAQVGGGSDRVHQWFVGTVEVKGRRYALAVVEENRSPNSASAALAAVKDIVSVLKSRL